MRAAEQPDAADEVRAGWEPRPSLLIWVFCGPKGGHLMKSRILREPALRRMGVAFVLCGAMSTPGEVVPDDGPVLAAIQVVALHRAHEMVARVWSGDVVYVAVAGLGRTQDPAPEVIQGLSDLPYSLRPESACPRDKVFKDLCRPEKGAVLIEVGPIKVGRDTADTSVGYVFSPTSGINCDVRLRAVKGKWTILDSSEHVGTCRVA